MSLEFATATRDALASLDPERTIFIFPVAPLEAHGPHLPLGLDLLEARELSLRLAKRLEASAGVRAVLMPAAPLGIESNTAELRVTVRAHVLRDWLVDACRALHRSRGFRYFVCVSGHLGPKQLTAIEEAGKLLRRRRFKDWGNRVRPALMSASSALTDFEQFRRAPLWLDPDEHGGSRDTSVAMALGQGDDLGRGLPKSPREEGSLRRYLDYLGGKHPTYWGDPASATAATGDRLLEAEVDKMVPKIQAVLGGANPVNTFKSWYSVLPIHKSFFKAWLLGLAIALIFVLWVLMSVQFLSRADFWT